MARSFRLEVRCRGFKDEEIKKAVRCESVGSGMELSTNMRDLEFEFASERSALAAAGRVKKAVRGVICILHSSKRV